MRTTSLFALLTMASTAFAFLPSDMPSSAPTTDADTGLNSRSDRSDSMDQMAEQGALTHAIPWSKRPRGSVYGEPVGLDDDAAPESDDDDAPAEEPESPESAVEARQVTRRQILERAEARRVKQEQKRLRKDVRRRGRGGMAGRQLMPAKRSYAVISERIYLAPQASGGFIRSFSNATLAECGAACNADSRCNQFDLAGPTYSPPKQCGLFNVIPTSSGARVDTQSAFLGSCATAVAQYNVPAASCMDTLL